MIMATKNKKRADGLYKTMVSWSDGAGKHKKYLYAKTPNELKEKETDLRVKLGLNLDITSEKDTFFEWKERWLASKKHDVAPTTYNSLVSTSKHLNPIYHYKIVDIRSSHIKLLINKLSSADDGSQLSHKTLKNICNVASQIFNFAIEDRVISHNPTTQIKIQKIENTNNRRALTDEEQQWIIDTPHRCQTAAMIMMFAGLRRGELIALTWSDIDFIEKTINVNKSVMMIKGQSVLKAGGKTDCANRKIYVPDILIDYLEKTPRYGINVCVSAKKEMLSETAFVRMWESYMRALNRKYGDFSNVVGVEMSTSKFSPRKLPMMIPPITSYWLRHTFATMLYLADVDVLTSKEQMGHSDIKTTLNIYTHLDKQFKKKKINKLNEYLSAK